MKLIKKYSKFIEGIQDDIQKSIQDKKNWMNTKFHLLVTNEGEEVHTSGEIKYSPNEGEVVIIDREGNEYPIGYSSEDDSIWVVRMGFDYIEDEEYQYAALRLDSDEPVVGYEYLDGDDWVNLGSRVNPSYEDDEDEDLGDNWVEWSESITESNSSDISTIEDELKGVEDKILSLVKFDIKTQKVNIDPSLDIRGEISHLSKSLGDDVMKEYNITAFLLKVKQILDLGRKSTKQVLKQEFLQFIASLENRNNKFEKEPESEYFDKIEGEESAIPRRKYEDEKYDIQVELKKLEEWVKSTGQRVAIVFEGRDAAGKGSTIKRFVEYLNPKNFRIVALGVPTEEEKNNWLGRYEKHLPNPGEIVFFDRSWYNRAVVEPAMGYCTEDQYKEFMEDVLPWEEHLIKDGLILIKFWFSITQEKQQLRFKIRQNSPLKYWKFSPNDAKVIDKYEVIGNYKNQMFNNTTSSLSPWVVINSLDKRIGQLNSMRYVLDVIDYEGKDESIAKWYPEVVNIIR